MNGVAVIEIKTYHSDHESTDRIVVQPGDDWRGVVIQLGRLLRALWRPAQQEEN